MWGAVHPYKVDVGRLETFSLYEVAAVLWGPVLFVPNPVSSFQTVVRDGVRGGGDDAHGHGGQHGVFNEWCEGLNGGRDTGRLFVHNETSEGNDYEKFG